VVWLGMGLWSPEVVPHLPCTRCPKLPWFPHWWWSCPAFAFPISAPWKPYSWRLLNRVFWPVQCPSMHKAVSIAAHTLLPLLPPRSWSLCFAPVLCGLLGGASSQC
jgi:hypothetical protein